MRFGAMNFPVKPVLDEIQEFAELGFDYLELTMDPPAAHYSQVQTMRRDIRSALGDAGMGLVCHLPTFVYTADLADGIRYASCEEMVRSLEVGAEMGAEKAVLHPGLIRGMAQYVKPRARELALDSLAGFVDAADLLNIPLCIENMFPAYGDWYTPDAFQDIFDRFPALRMTLDTGHANISHQDGSRLRKFAERHADRIDHIHISDNSGKADEHLPLGAGTVDFDWLAKHLNQVGFDSTVTLEVFTEDRQLVKESREAFAALMTKHAGS